MGRSGERMVGGKEEDIQMVSGANDPFLSALDWKLGNSGSLSSFSFCSSRPKPGSARPKPGTPEKEPEDLFNLTVSRYRLSLRAAFKVGLLINNNYYRRSSKHQAERAQRGASPLPSPVPLPTGP
ncbi:hypothetical protein NHX12_003724 [Muraenolepis orangiensis]|uniref:Uncharacterized protein n=1 Tax=Muraenolepis orangiensis TaxID=630683 RepID=A0A9Q0IBJ5_9TELE|nr:hypothetical protein NHX12_003724 [Muraenolepis orangiensis]